MRESPSRCSHLPDEARAIERRYYAAMTMPLIIDVVISGIYTGIIGRPDLFLRNCLVGGLVLGLGVHVAARLLFQPIRAFLATGTSFDGIERRLTQLPLRSANAVMWLYLPLLLIRLFPGLIAGMAPEGIPVPTWTDSIVTLITQTLFGFVFTYFLVSGYLERLCSFLFKAHAVNLGLFFGSFARKIIVALLFIALAPIALIAAEIVSYEGERLMREVAIDLAASAFGLGVTLFWISSSLTRPLGRLETGMGKVADGDLSIRLPVTSNEEIGQVTAHFNRMVEGLRERRRIRETFGKYVSETVAAALLQEAGDGRLSGEMRTATLLFTDIEGFTALAERLPPDTLIAVLNEYLEVVLEPIQRHGGVVNSFSGDGLFASFNLPLANDRHAECAVAAALAIQAALAPRVFTGDVRLKTRIGINSGMVVGGTIGAGERLGYTLLGDAVNTAARLQELNKAHGTSILVSEATRRLAADGFRFRRIGEVPIRGRSETLVLHTLEEGGGTGA